MNNSSINKPFWKTKTFWLSVGSFASFGVEIINTVNPFIPEKMSDVALAHGGIFAALAALAARQGGVESAREVAVDMIRDPKTIRSRKPPQV